MDKEAKFAHAFNVIHGMGALKLEKLRKSFGSFENSWSATTREIKEKTGDEDIALIL